MNYINYFQNHRTRLFQDGGEFPDFPTDAEHGDYYNDRKNRKRYIRDKENNTWIDVQDPDASKRKRVTDIISEKKQAEALLDDEASAFRTDQMQKGLISQAGIDPSFIGNENGQISQGAAAAIGGFSTYGVQAMNAVDQLAMGDKNFGAQSQAIDDAVHGVSGALMKSGNPYAMAAGAGLEAANFLTKATGQNTQGYDVNINSSGYGQLGHKDSSASRDFLGAIGLGGLDGGKMDQKLASRNEEAQMALKASNVADTIKFQQEARMNSVDDVIRQNQIALSGGLDTNAIAN